MPAELGNPNNRDKMKPTMKHCIALLLLCSLTTPLVAQETSPVHMANGIKIGEVTSTTAIIWTRLTKNAEPNVAGKPFPKNINRARKSASFDDLSAMEGSCPGVEGEVRVTYWPVEHESQSKSTEWQAVDSSSDFIHQAAIRNLLPGSRYALKVEGRPQDGAAARCQVEGGFGTAPSDEEPTRVSFACVTGQDYPRRDTPQGHQIYPIMQKLKLDFFVHTGDIEYYDKPGPYADTVELARFKWNRIYALPYQRAFHNVTASYAQE